MYSNTVSMSTQRRSDTVDLLLINAKIIAKILLHFKPSVWKSSTRKQLFIRSFLHFLDDCEDYLISDCEFKQGHPVKQWSVTIGDPKLTRLNLFRVRLLVGCAGLEKDAARFRLRNRSGSEPGDPCCKLCGAAEKDAIHFIAVCSSLASCRTTLISSAPESVRSIIPD